MDILFFVVESAQVARQLHHERTQMDRDFVFVFLV